MPKKNKTPADGSLRRASPENIAWDAEPANTPCEFGLSDGVVQTMRASAFDVPVVVEDQGGWVLVHCIKRLQSEQAADLVAALRLALAQFFATRPHLRLSSVTPLAVGGSTTELIGIYDQVGWSLDDRIGPAPRKPGKRK